MYPGLPLEVDLTNPNPEIMDAGVPAFSYDIISAAQRQRSFNYNSSLPHFRDKKFLKNAIKRLVLLELTLSFYTLFYFTI